MNETHKKLYRSRDHRMIAGVAGGIAEYLNIDPTVIRLLIVILIFMTGGAALLLYIAAAIIIPEEPAVPTPTP